MTRKQYEQMQRSINKYTERLKYKNSAFQNHKHIYTWKKLQALKQGPKFTFHPAVRNRNRQSKESTSRTVRSNNVSFGRRKRSNPTKKSQINDSNFTIRLSMVNGAEGGNNLKQSQEVILEQSSPVKKSQKRYSALTTNMRKLILK